ncbi:MAG: hypothetical protein V5B40_17570 [Candidatus Accumulibacter meliphilus]|jgi:hypothetical protein|uniref:hypothetical protein n=1 Tax=Candidatus Accumulibacter meliphilus TaxID=2211374 RepID=UPI002FC34F12
MADIAFEWVVSESQLSEQVTAIEVDGGTVEDSGVPFRPGPGEEADYQAANFEPLTVIVAVASIAFIAQVVHKMMRDHNVRGGTIVDTRSGKLRIRPVPTMATGRLVIVENAGTTIFDKDEANAGQKLLSEILTRGGKIQGS